MAAFALAAPCAAGQGVVLEAGMAEVVLSAKPFPAERFAAQEMTNFLSRVLGAPVPVVEKEEGKRKKEDGKGKREEGRRCRIFLGRAAGFDVSDFERDAFRIKVERSADGAATVRIAGRDNPSADINAMLAGGGNVLRTEHATLFGVYAFLEDFAGVRFYFPGELGTVAKRRESVAVPVQDKTTAPWFTARSTIISRDGVWYEPLPSGWHQNAGKALCWLRHRFETARIPCCHGQNKFKIVEREGEGMDFPRARQFPLRHDGLDPSGVRVRDGRVLARATRNGYLASDAVCGRRRAL